MGAMADNGESIIGHADYAQTTFHMTLHATRFKYTNSVKVIITLSLDSSGGRNLHTFFSSSLTFLSLMEFIFDRLSLGSLLSK